MSTRPWVLAIDFGTSFTVAAVAREGSPPETIEIEGERRVPSVILAEDATTLVVGRVAEELSGSNPSSTLRTPKNRLGDHAPVILGGRSYSIVALVARLFSFVYTAAVSEMGSAPTEVLLTHPAAWNAPRAARLLEAAAQAGLPNPKLVSEPVAAAWSYASEVGVDPGAFVAVYDLGGGTFDTAVVTSDGSEFTIVGRPGGEASIGGELFDELLANHIGSRLDPVTWEGVQVADDPALRQVGATLRNEARRAKEVLSAHEYADILLPLPTGMQQIRVTRAEFEQLVAPFVAETSTHLARCVNDAGISPSNLTAVYLVGGASRSPIVERTIAAAFPGVGISRRGDPKTAVALGALRGNAAPAIPTVDDVHARNRTRVGAAPTNLTRAPVPAPVPVPAPASVSGPAVVDRAAASKPRAWARWPFVLGTIVAAVLVVVGIIAFTGNGNGNGPRKAATVTTVPTVPTVRSTTAVATVTTVTTLRSVTTAASSTSTAPASGTADVAAPGQVNVDAALLPVSAASTATGETLTLDTSVPLRPFCEFHALIADEAHRAYDNGKPDPGHATFNLRILTFATHKLADAAFTRLAATPSTCRTDTYTRSGVEFAVVNSTLGTRPKFGPNTTALLSTGTPPASSGQAAQYTVSIGVWSGQKIVITAMTTYGAAASATQTGELVAFTTAATAATAALP